MHEVQECKTYLLEILNKLLHLKKIVRKNGCSYIYKLHYDGN